jgi:hypothetical protein
MFDSMFEPKIIPLSRTSTPVFLAFHLCRTSRHLQVERDGHAPEPNTSLSTGTMNVNLLDCHDFVERAAVG